MSNLLSFPRGKRHIIGFILLLGAVNGALAQGYKTRFDADEALLEKLQKKRLTTWMSFQLDIIRKRHPSRSGDLGFLDALYAPNSTQRIERLKMIGKGTPRYGEAQLGLAREFKKATERLPYIRNAYVTLKGNKAKVAKADYSQKLLITTLVKIGTKKSIDEALKIIKEYTGGDKRFMEYQAARLQLILADNMLDENGKLTLGQKAMVEGVIKVLVNGDLFWQNDYIAMLGYCELAHAYILLNKPNEAYKQLKSPFKMMKELGRQFPQEMRVHSPEIPAKYYMAKAYVQLYRLVKAGKVKPPRIPKRDGKNVKLVQLTQAQAIKYYLIKAFNIFQYELQVKYVRKARLAQRSLLEVSKLRPIMVSEGLKPPAPKQSQMQQVAWETAVDLYSDKKYKEAIPHFEIAGKDKSGRFRSDKALKCLFFLSVCHARTDQFEKAIGSAKKATLNFKSEERAWDAIYIIGAEANKAASSYRENDKEKYLKLKKISSDMFNYIVKENSTYSKAEGAIYQQGNERWAEAVAANKRKGEAQAKLDDTIKKTPNSTQIKALRDERDRAFEEMKAAYLAAAEPFDLLLKNYASSKYCTKAIHKLAWIYLIIQDKPKAISYFKMYCERDTTPTAEFIDSKYWIANTMFQEGERQKAMEYFDEIIMLTDSKNKKYVLPENGADAAKRKILKARQKSLGLKPWVYVQWGDDFLETSIKMVDDVEELDILIKGYEMTIAEAEKGKKETVQLTLATTPDIAKTASKTFKKGTLPADFAFKEFFLRASMRVNLVKALPDDVSVRMKDGLLWMTKNHDSIGEIGGKGFDVDLSGTAVNWNGQGKKIACYRDNKLVCIYDPENIEYRPAKEGEAIEVLELPPMIQVLTIKEAKIRHRFMIKQRDANNKRYMSKRREGLRLQNNALAGLRYFVDNYKKDEDFAPMSLLQIAKIYVNQEKFVDATDALSELQKSYPRSPAAKQASIYYFRAIMNAMEKEKDDEKRKTLQVKANSQAKSIMKDIKKLSIGNLRLLAFRLFETDEFGEATNISPELSSAALDEVLRRATDDDSLRKSRERALYLKALSLYLKKDYGNADQQIGKLLAENDKTAYLFKCMLLRCKVLRKLKKLDESIGIANKVIRKTSAAKDRFKVEYWTGVLEMCRTLLVKKEGGARTAKLWLGQIIAQDVKDDVVRPIREAAYFELVRAYFMLRDSQQAEKTRSDYLLSYPNGSWKRRISMLN